MLGPIFALTTTAIMIPQIWKGMTKVVGLEKDVTINDIPEEEIAPIDSDLEA